MKDGSANTVTGITKLVRALASSDEDVREATLTACVKWLEARDEVKPLDMKKIWKGKGRFGSSHEEEHF